MADLIDPNKAVDYLIEKSKEFAQAKAERSHLEHFRKSKKALLMNACTEKAIAAREQFAYSHPEYIEVLAGIKAAIEREELLRWRLEAARLRVEVWRSENANNRRLEGATR
ncbi:hypothetical protein [Acidovorax sp. sif1233]|uniref:hypothetical protein n=1 Tax=Acidovorax sp. sif1233 TaxID=2854792 RepID=UPI00210258ED|nr:hypothetical protein [Acidovorax sp. sif1233]